MGNGFGFDYDGEELSDSYVMDGIDGKSNEDDIPLTVRCSKCGEYMDFEDGEYVCPNCDSSVDEMDLYSKLNDENKRFLKEHDLE